MSEKQERTLRVASRYMGIKGTASEALAELMEDAYGEMISAAKPAHVLKRADIRVEGETLFFGPLPPQQSRDLCRLLAPCQEGYGLLATLGMELELHIKKLGLTDPALAAAVSACGSAYIDEYIDEVLRAEGLRLAQSKQRGEASPLAQSTAESKRRGEASPLAQSTAESKRRGEASPLALNIAESKRRGEASPLAQSTAESKQRGEASPLALNIAESKRRGEASFLTPRFSPGYGDASLSMQRVLLPFLDAQKLGIYLTEGLLMIPEKSVSALMGITAEPQDPCMTHCTACPQTDCAFREE